MKMTFDDITEDGRLWAVRYETECDNELYRLFDQWSDVLWLRTFFKQHIADLEKYFHITDINQAIKDTLEDSNKLEAVILDLSPDADLDLLFKPLDNNRTALNVFEWMKARAARKIAHVSWLRIYALRLADGVYIVTGGAIKLAPQMKDRPHTQHELQKIEQVKQFLISEGIVDNEGFIEYVREL